jgi:hypothetical protein
MAGQVVPAPGEGDVDLLAHSSIELRGSSGAGSGTAGQPFELGREKSFVDQFVEMELCGVPRDVQAGGGLVAAHGPRLMGDEVVQGPPEGIGQRTHAAHALGEAVEILVTGIV